MTGPRVVAAWTFAPQKCGKMVQHRMRLFIVSREQADLYERARAASSRAPEVQVIYDRRLRQRRQGGQAPSLEHRQQDRRVRPDVDAEILAFGSAIVSGERDPV